MNLLPGALVLALASSSSPALRAQCAPVEVERIFASDAHAGDQFGASVALSGDTAIIGAPDNNLLGFPDLGSVYIVERNLGGPGAWGQRAQLVPSDLARAASFGWGVALQGDLAVVNRNWDPLTTTGSIYIFERNLGGQNAWGERRKLTSGVPNSQFGQAFALDGDTLAIWSLAPSGGSVGGQITIVERNLGGPDQWGLRIQFPVPATPVSSSSWVSWLALDLDTLVVGDAWPHQTVFVFERHFGGTNAWGLTQVIPQASPQSYPAAYFGSRVAIKGDRLAVSAPQQWLAAPIITSGAVHLYERAGAGAPWIHVKSLQPSQPNFGAFFGSSLDLESDRLLVGAELDDAAAHRSGSAWIYERDLGGPDAWGESARLVASNAFKNDEYGASGALEGDTILIGAPLRGHGANTNKGAVYVDGVWSATVNYCTAGTSLNGCAPTLSANGAASASAGQGFTISASGVDGLRTGIFYYGLSGASAAVWAPNSSSWRCVNGPFQRTGDQNSGGTAGACNGMLWLDWNLFIATHPSALGAPFSGGETIWIQAWYRDPGASKQTQLSDALRFSVCP